jgi:hypothetical protein
MSRTTEGVTMSDEQGYNGWKNYETWAMALWIDNDRGSYTYSRELARDVIPRYEFATKKTELASQLRDWQEEEMPELEASVWSDLLRCAFSEVDWFEIAENYLSEITEDA